MLQSKFAFQSKLRDDFVLNVEHESSKEVWNFAQMWLQKIRLWKIVDKSDDWWVNMTNNSD